MHNQVRVEPQDQSAVERLARYIIRPPISLERMQWGGDGEVLYQPKGGHDGCARQPGAATETFDPAEFLARVIMHIPEPRRHLVRCYGAYSNVSRGKRRQQPLARGLHVAIAVRLAIGVRRRCAGSCPTGRRLPTIQVTARRVRARLGT